MVMLLQLFRIQLGSVVTGLTMIYTLGHILKKPGEGISPHLLSRSLNVRF